MQDESNPTTILKPHLVLHQGQAMTTSMAVAKHFGKLHRNVLKAINNLECSTGFTRLNFEQCFRINELANGKPEPYYRITRDGFVFLAMGFTGKAAAAWKEAYIAAFNRMEQVLITRLRAESASFVEERDEFAGYVIDLADRVSELEAEARALRAERHELGMALDMAKRHISGPEELGVMMVLCDMRSPDAQLLGFLSRKVFEMDERHQEPLQASADQLARAIGWTSSQQVRKALQRLEDKGLLRILRERRGRTPSYAVRTKRIEALLKAHREGQHGRIGEQALTPDAESPVAEMIRRIVGMPQGQHDDQTEARIKDRNLLPGLWKGLKPR